MAKIAAILVSLILLGSWGWLAWDAYTDLHDARENPSQWPLELDDISNPTEPTPVGFVRFLTGLETPPSLASEQEREEARFLLMLAVSVSFALVFLSLTARGVPLSVGFMAFSTALSAGVHALVSIYPMTIVAVRTIHMINEQEKPGPAALTAFFTFSLLIIPSLVAVFRLPALARGSRNAMVSTLKCQAILLSVMLLQFMVHVDDLVVDTYFIAYAIMSAASMILITLTRSNYRYD
jgi:hypothetical protein